VAWEHTPVAQQTSDPDVPAVAAAAPGAYDPATFWESRLRARFDVAAAGFRGLGRTFNEALYRQRDVVLRRAIRRYRLPVDGADILELGPGSGFYVSGWKARGVRSLVGLDITTVVAERLSAAYPEYRFERADITERWPVPDASADIVTAFDVLFHIVDDDRFDAALAEAGRVLRPGGYLLISDLFLHGSTFRGFHQVGRTIDTYTATLDAAGLEVVGRLPIFVTMHPAIDVPAGWRRSLADQWWSALEAKLVKSPRLGRRIGTVLFWIDRALTLPFRGGPSTELMVARRR
jgi:SAM-dependent methyltransferase